MDLTPKIDRQEAIFQELMWLETIIAYRANEVNSKDETHIQPVPKAPSLADENDNYAQLIRRYEMTNDERIIFILALAPHISPSIFEHLLANKRVQRMSEIATIAGGNAVMPTIGTGLFLLSGNNARKRHENLKLFDVEHFFYKRSILDFVTQNNGQTELQHMLVLNQSYRDLILRNRDMKPRFSEQFPAHPLESNLNWQDLVLMTETRERLNEVKARLEHYNELIENHGLRKHAKPGCRILFYGESGTGKTLAATLLGKHLDKEVYRVDLSTVTSKYIGETSKRLNSLFNIAESKGWILFFDEGDAILGQRRSMEQAPNSSQYANQDTAFLLQRIERYDGIVIVATNFKSNIDQAFTRRFEVTVRFEVLNEAMQYDFWTLNLPQTIPLAADCDLRQWIQRHPLSPAGIISVIYRASILTLDKGEAEISTELLLRCIRDEEIKYKGRVGFNR